MSEGVRGARAVRRFGQADQERFAKISGDRNPLHLDPDFARRTAYGVPLVHGIHLVLWAIEAAGLPEPGTWTGVSARFTSPLAAGEEVALLPPVATEPGTVRLNLVAGQRKIGRIVLRSAPRPDPIPEDWHAPPLDPQIVPRHLDLAGLDGDAGRFDPPAPDGVAAAFPAAVGQLGADLAVALAAASYAVGMACPGLHSLFMQVDVHRTRPGLSPNRDAAYRVRSVDPRFGIAEMDFRTGTTAGSLRAALRPGPIVQPSPAALLPLVDPSIFAGQRALVIGGSRGLGEVVAKLVALGGGEPVITYKNGRAEAAAIQAELRSVGRPCSIVRYDAAVATEAQLAALPFDPTHFYYFATPPIFRLKREIYEPDLFRAFSACYVDGFAALCAALAARSLPIVGFFPSSVAVAQPEPGLTEYAAAKLAGETVAARFDNPRSGLTVLTRRLPRVLTDQTGTVSPVISVPAADVLLPIVEAMQRAWAR